MSDAWKPWPVCPAEGCDETEGVTIMECAPGYTYMTVGDVCFHWVTFQLNPDMPQEQRAQLVEYFRLTDVPRETKED